jgi:hypothetical protein
MVAGGWVTTGIEGGGYAPALVSIMPPFRSLSPLPWRHFCSFVYLLISRKTGVQGYHHFPA